MTEATPPFRDYPPFDNINIHWPLTSDLLDDDGGNAFLSPGNFITAQGFAGNGSSSKAVFDVPPTAQRSRVSLFAVAKAAGPPAGGYYREVVATINTATSPESPRLELAVVADPANSTLGMLALRTNNGSSTTVTPLNRTGWHYEFQFPELILNTTPIPQSICFLDATTLLLAAYAGTKSVIYRVDLTTGEYTGRASSTTYQHINSMHLAQDDSVWVQCVVGGFDQRKQLDLATSFVTGAITESASWNTGDVPTSAIAFATAGGVEYVLLSQFSSSSNTKVYVFLRSQMSGTVNQVDRVKRFDVGANVQDIVQRASDGHVYVSRSSASGGQVQAYDLAAILAGPDDSSPTPVLTFPAPTIMSEGLDFHPTTDRMWMLTEGLTSLADRQSHCAVWSSALTGPEWNSYLFDYYSNQMQVRLNGRLFTVLSEATPPPVPTKLGLGVHPAVTATGPNLGYLSTGGYVRSVALKSADVTADELAAWAV